jgi:hypothetical protein
MEQRPCKNQKNCFGKWVKVGIIRYAHSRPCVYWDGATTDGATKAVYLALVFWGGGDGATTTAYWGCFGKRGVAGLGTDDQKNAIAATAPIATAFKFCIRHRKSGPLNRLPIELEVRVWCF